MPGVGRLRPECHRSMGLCRKPRPILRGEIPVMLRAEAATPFRSRRRDAAPTGGTSGGGTPGGGTSAGETLFDALRAWRSAEAKAQSLPPYVIFHDTVLREIAAVRPASLEELGEIKGVGASKLQRYGSRVLKVLGSHA